MNCQECNEPMGLNAIPLKSGGRVFECKVCGCGIITPAGELKPARPFRMAGYLVRTPTDGDYDALLDRPIGLKNEAFG